MPTTGKRKFLIASVLNKLGNCGYTSWNFGWNRWMWVYRKKRPLSKTDVLCLCLETKQSL